MTLRRLAGVLVLAVSLLLSSAAHGEVMTGLSIFSFNTTAVIGQPGGLIRFSAHGALDTGFVRDLGHAVGLGVGDEHACALLADGNVYCWGDNQRGQLGDGTTPPFCFVGGAPEPASFDRLWACSNAVEVGAYLAAHASPTAVPNAAGTSAVATGRFHSCALVGGTVRCWGANQVGQLGAGSPALSSPAPVTVSGITTATAITAGAGHTCALLADGTVQCWGTNSNGELGDDGVAIGFSPVPVTVSGLSNVVDVSAGGIHTCAVLEGGTVKCWGAFGQLGDGTGARSFTPVTVSGISTAESVRSSRFHSCALLADGTARCWGQNSQGQLGDGTTTSRDAPVIVSGLTGVESLAEGWGGLHTCTVLEGGALDCWGFNGQGQLGDGTTTRQLTPMTLPSITTASRVAAGLAHTCALLDSGGSIACWGDNAGGQLGDGSGTARLTPGGVAGITVAWSSSAPAVASIDADGLVTPRSAGTTTITGRSGPFSASAPVTVSSVLTVNVFGGHGTVTSSDNVISCFPICSASYATGTAVTLTATAGPGTVFVEWTGDCTVVAGLTCTVDTSVTSSVTARFELRDFVLTVNATGSGTVTSSPAGISCGSTCAAAFPAIATSTIPFVTDAVVTLTAAPSLGWFFAGWGGACAGTGACTVTLTADKAVTATFTAVTLTSTVLTAPSPVMLVGKQQPLTLTGTFSDGSTRPLGGSPNESGDAYTCVIMVDGTVQCWGALPTGVAAQPTTMPGIRTATALGAGTAHACAVLRDGTLSCWGLDYSGLNNPVPATIAGISDVTAIAAGYLSCAILENQSVACWNQGLDEPASLVPVDNAVHISNEGSGHACAVFDGTVDDPVAGRVICSDDPPWAAPVPRITDAVAVAASPVSVCALLASGSVKCWSTGPGNGFHGELGDGRLTASATPVTVAGITDAIGITSGDLHSCALLASGKVKCWGSNELGQAGDGTVAFGEPTPVTVVEIIGGITSDLTGVVALNAGDTRTCATIADGTLRCWGYNLMNGLAVGGGENIVPEARPVIGVSNVLALLWSSSSPAVAVVMANGRVVARGPGTTTITATVNGGVVASTTLTVVNTPTGAGVAVTPVTATGATPVTVTYSAVGTAGTTSVLTSTTGPPPPTGFAVGAPATYYDVTTTAGVTAPITVCIRYAGITFSGASPQLFHFENRDPLAPGWVDHTTSVDTVTQTVCGVVSSLSPFALFQRVTTPPVVTPHVSPAPGAGGWHTTAPVTVTWSVTGASASTGCGATTLTSQTPGTVLTCRATNGAGLTTSVSVTVKIDTTPPVVDCRMTPATLWPPDHRMGPVSASVTVHDALSGPAGFTVKSATSNEPDNGLGDGDRGGDIQGFVTDTTATTGSLRAERSGRGDGREYRLTWTGADAAGNTDTCTATVRVPHSQSRR